MSGTLQYQMRRHPVVTFLAVMIVGPYLLAAALLVLIVMGLFFLLAALFPANR